jgi:hypothetical protein
MNVFSDVNEKRKRESGRLTRTMGTRLVLNELLRRGFDAQLVDSYPRQNELLIAPHSATPGRIQVKTVHLPPWYIRRVSYFRANADCVTVYVLLGSDETRSARFFVVGSNEIMAQVRQTASLKKFEFIDLEAVKKYEDNWKIIRS